MLWGTRQFRGARPKIDDRLLGPEAATLARNCWLTSGAIRPVPELVPAGVDLGVLTGTIYRFSPTQWFAWSDDIDVAPAPVRDDTVRRTYWTGDGVPKMTTTTIMGVFAGPGVPNSRNLGIPAPTQAPAVAVIPLPNHDQDVGFRVSVLRLHVGFGSGRRGSAVSRERLRDARLRYGRQHSGCHGHHRDRSDRALRDHPEAYLPHGDRPERGNRVPVRR